MPAGLQLADLGRGLGLDFIGRQAAQQGERAKLAIPSRKCGSPAWLPLRSSRLRTCVWCKQRSAVHQDDVAAHSQSRRGLRQTHRFLKCLAVGHQRRRSHDPVFVGFHDGAIHARRETEIVGVDDQAAHRASLAGMCRVNATSSRLESSAGILPAVPRASRPRRGGRYARRHSRRDGGATKTDPAPPGSYFFAALTFAQRAFCARRIAARPLALKGRRVLFFDAPLPL